MLTPPLMLIAAAGAERFEHLVQPEFWRQIFRGRSGDLFLIYAAYLGGILMVALLALPVFAAIALQSLEAGLVFGGLVLAFGIGFAVTLLGRLCGFFAGSSPEESVEPATSRPRSPAPAPGTSPAPVLEMAGLPAAGARTPSGKGPLLEARRRVEEIEERMKIDLPGAIRALEELRETYAPNPIVLHALCMARQSAGNDDEALSLARETLPLLLERGNMRHAAEIYRAFIDSPEALRVSGDQQVVIAGALRDMGDPATATTIYFRMLREDPLDKRALKKALQIADDHLHANPEEALGIYRFLAEQCARSPLADYVREGVKEAERRVAMGRQKSA
jgi:hypothetical protein